MRKAAGVVRSGGRRVRLLAAWGARHPFSATALLSSACVAASVIFIWRSRLVGTYDPDELGYLATALRYSRSFSWFHPWDLSREVFSTVLGPLVPLLSSALLLLGPRDPRVAMLVQPLMLLLTALATTGIARRFVPPWPAILAGVYVAALPAMGRASESYWYGLGAAATVVCAVWTLLESDRLANRWAYVFGALLGAMLLTRTMTLGFLPGLLLGALLLAWGDRRRLTKLLGAVATMTLVAGPWWWIRRNDILGYLFDYGFGPEAAEWGSGGPIERIALRIGQTAEASVLSMPRWAVLVGVVGVAWGLVVLLRAQPRAFVWTDRRAEYLSIVVVVLTGAAALASTTNSGVWFELPLAVLVVPLLAVPLSRSPAPLRGALVLVVVASVVTSVSSVREDRMSHADEAFAQSDPRFLDDDVAVRFGAAEEWWEVAVDLTAELESMTARRESGVISMTGNTFLMNSNSVTLAAELAGWDAKVEVPPTFDPADIGNGLTPTSEDRAPDGTNKERVLVVVNHDLPLFTPDMNWRDLRDWAQEHGWRQAWTRALPGGGTVEILRHGPPGDRSE